MLSARLTTQRLFPGVLEQSDVSPDLLLVSWRPLHHNRTVGESWRALLQLVVERIAPLSADLAVHGRTRQHPSELAWAWRHYSGTISFQARLRGALY